MLKTVTERIVSLHEIVVFVARLTDAPISVSLLIGYRVYINEFVLKIANYNKLKLTKRQ